MKYILLILCLALVGCKQDKNLQEEYMQAGMFDEAEKIYQDAILNESHSELKDWNKHHLLTFYYDTGQIDKAYEYASSLIIRTSVALNIAIEIDNVANDYSMMKNHLRAMRLYNKSANLYITYGNLHEQLDCPELAIGSYRNAYVEAMLGGYLNEAKKYKEAALKIIDSERCLSNVDAQSQKEIFEFKKEAFE
jgi:lipopolysaccharide biosynthesis regulator YciM